MGYQHAWWGMKCFTKSSSMPPAVLLLLPLPLLQPPLTSLRAIRREGLHIIIYFFTVYFSSCYYYYTTAESKRVRPTSKCMLLSTTCDWHADSDVATKFVKHKGIRLEGKPEEQRVDHVSDVESHSRLLAVWWVIYYFLSVVHSNCL